MGDFRAFARIDDAETNQTAGCSIGFRPNGLPRVNVLALRAGFRGAGHGVPLNGRDRRFRHPLERRNGANFDGCHRVEQRPLHGITENRDRVLG